MHTVLQYRLFSYPLNICWRHHEVPLFSPWLSLDGIWNILYFIYPDAKRQTLPGQVYIQEFGCHNFTTVVWKSGSIKDVVFCLKCLLFWMAWNYQIVSKQWSCHELSTNTCRLFVIFPKAFKRLSLLSLCWMLPCRIDWCLSVLCFCLWSWIHVFLVKSACVFALPCQTWILCFWLQARQSWRTDWKAQLGFLEFISTWRPPLSWCSENGLTHCRLCCHLYNSVR